MVEGMPSHANPRPLPASGERLVGNLPGHFGHQARIGGIQQEYSFYVNYACLITDDAAELPHIGGTVIDSAESKDQEVLRSEVVAAIAFLKLQFRCGHFCHHHTLPVSTLVHQSSAPLCLSSARANPVS